MGGYRRNVKCGEGCCENTCVIYDSGLGAYPWRWCDAGKVYGCGDEHVVRITSPAFTGSQDCVVSVLPEYRCVPYVYFPALSVDVRVSNCGDTSQSYPPYYCDYAGISEDVATATVYNYPTYDCTLNGTSTSSVSVSVIITAAVLDVSSNCYDVLPTGGWAGAPQVPHPCGDDATGTNEDTCSGYVIYVSAQDESQRGWKCAFVYRANRGIACDDEVPCKYSPDYSLIYTTDVWDATTFQDCCGGSGYMPHGGGNLKVCNEISGFSAEVLS